MPQNALGQEIAPEVPDWTARALPPKTAMVGRLVRVEPLDPGRHGRALAASLGEDREGRLWTYLPQGPFASDAEFQHWLERFAAGSDPMLHAVVDAKTSEAIGITSFMRIEPAHGVIEVGYLHFSPRLQRTTAATEAMALMMARVFDELGYRRYEWKCNALNEASRAAALRLGFRFEGIFRQAMVVKGRNRDTAWFSIIDSEWPALKRGFAQFLDPANFDAAGRQRRSLASFRA